MTKLLNPSALIAAGFQEEQWAEVSALCSFLYCEASELSQESYDHYGLNLYSIGGQSYAIGTDEQAEKACAEYIRDSVWAFNAEFICSECNLPSEFAEGIRLMQEKCESANEPLLALVESHCPGGLEGSHSFTESAILADGRGHFLSGYDGEENEVTVEDSGDHPGGTFYIYRTN